MIRTVGASALALVLWAGPAAAEFGDEERGRNYSVANCARCHVVADGVGKGTDGAPPFKSMPNELKRTEPQLRAFLARPHGAMPDFSLTRQEIADVVAYIESLRNSR